MQINSLKLTSPHEAVAVPSFTSFFPRLFKVYGCIVPSFSSVLHSVELQLNKRMRCNVLANSPSEDLGYFDSFQGIVEMLLPLRHEDGFHKRREAGMSSWT